MTSFSEHAERVRRYINATLPPQYPLMRAETRDATLASLADMERLYEEALSGAEVAEEHRQAAMFACERAERLEAALAAAQEVLHQLVGFEASGSMQETTVLAYLPTLRVIVDNARSSLSRGLLRGEDETR